MTRWYWSLVALSAAVAAVVLAIAWPSSSDAKEPQTLMTATPWAYIDKNIDNGDGPCDPEHIDDVTTEVVGDSHKLAVCIGNPPTPVGGFSLVVSYDPELDECLDEECPVEPGTCLDDNPDANAGLTHWGDGLGDNWDCYLEPGEPQCDYSGDDLQSATNGDSAVATAFIYCDAVGMLGATFTLGDDEDWGALAVLDLGVLAAGTDEVEIEGLSVWDSAGSPIGYCGGLVFASARPEAANFVEEMPCLGATDIKKEPTPPHRKTSTPTEEPTATEVPPTATSPPPPTSPPPTATPYGGPAGVGIEPPPTGSGASGGGFPWVLTAWLLAGTAGAAATAGGFYLRFARGRRRSSG